MQWLTILAIVLAIGMSPGHAAGSVLDTTVTDPNLSAIDGLLAQPEERVDLAGAEVIIERMIDPHVDAQATLRLFDEWASRARSRFPQGDSTANDTRMAVLVSTLYEPGSWNDFRPFGYDLDDELGLSITGKLMSRYLASRKGNCVSMPVLLVILGQKLGLPVTLATAPNHVYAKYKRDNGEWLNIEATTGGTKSDAKYQEEFGISSRAMAAGIYLRPLRRREDLLVLVGTLMQFYGEARAPEQVIPITDAVVRVDPNNIVALLVKRNAYRRIVQERYVTPYPSPDQMPASMRGDYMRIYGSQKALVGKIESLGWVPETQQHRAAYLQSTQQVKASQHGGVQ